ncbi:cell division regulator GpsB [Sporosarcina sp. CAU 1771]
MDTKLDSKTILEKEFKTGIRGYNQEEVDLFLDDIIQDYQTFNKAIIELKNENARIQEELTAAQKRPAAGSVGTTNFDLLKRISNLERHVFGSKMYEQE